MSNPCQAASFLRTLLLSADLSVPVSLLFSAGDDVYALWGAKLNPENVTFRRNVAVNPGILRPNWYGNCVATYVSAERSGPALPPSDSVGGLLLAKPATIAHSQTLTPV